MKKYSLLVFDWDGTLVDSEGFAIEALQKTAADFNYPIPTTEEIREFFGQKLETLLQQFFPQDRQAELAQKFYQHFTEEELVTRFFTGTLETLRYLKQQGFILAIATNRARTKLNMALDTTNIKGLFTATRCPEDGAPKPAPDMLLTLLDELDTPAQNALMIGDTIFDMQFARNAAVDALAVCYGHHRKEQLAAFNPVGFIENIQDLKHILTD